MNDLELSDIIKKFMFELNNITNKLQNLDPKKDEKEKKKLLKELNSLKKVDTYKKAYDDSLTEAKKLKEQHLTKDFN